MSDRLLDSPWFGNRRALCWRLLALPLSFKLCRALIPQCRLPACRIVGADRFTQIGFGCRLRLIPLSIAPFGFDGPLGRCHLPPSSVATGAPDPIGGGDDDMLGHPSGGHGMGMLGLRGILPPAPRPRARRPACRMSRAIRFRFTRHPVAHKSAVIRGRPSHGRGRRWRACHSPSHWAFASARADVRGCRPGQA